MTSTVKMGIHGKYWVPIFVFFLFLGLTSIAQKRELGGGVGVLSYTGDLSRNVFTNPIKPGVNVFYRFNMRDHLSIRVSFLAGGLAGTDAKPIDAFATARSTSFNIFLSEFSTGLEYYFLNFRGKRPSINWSPYFMGGIGIFGMLGHQNKTATFSNVQLAIPLAFGARYRASPRWSFAVEAGVRATLFDYLDNTSEGNLFNKDFQYGNPFDNDKYYFAGVTVSYTFYKVQCPGLPLEQTYRRR